MIGADTGGEGTAVPVKTLPDGSILAVTSEPPWPLNSGGHLRTFHLLRSLSQRFRVRLVIPVPRGGGSVIDALERAGMIVVPVEMEPRSSWNEACRAARAAVLGEPYVMFRRHDHRRIRNELARQAAIEQPDLYYLDHLDSLVYSNLGGMSPIVLDLHNVYSLLVRRVSREQRSWWKRLYLEREASLLARIESHAVKRAGGIMTVSHEEAVHFRQLGASTITVVPNGVDCPLFEDLPTGREEKSFLILYVGDMSWGPNIGAAVFLAHEVLPKLRGRLPRVRLRIVGRNPAPEVKSLARLPGIEVTGGVPSIKPHLLDAQVLAVPLDSGGGTRLKILEAFAAGLPVVSTSVGCEGLLVDHETHLLVAERDHFADELLRLLSESPLAHRLATRARDLARDRYDWTIVGEAACDLASELINCRRSGPQLSSTPLRW